MTYEHKRHRGWYWVLGASKLHYFASDGPRGLTVSLCGRWWAPWLEPEHMDDREGDHNDCVGCERKRQKLEAKHDRPTHR